MDVTRIHHDWQRRLAAVRRMSERTALFAQGAGTFFYLLLSLLAALLAEDLFMMSVGLRTMLFWLLTGGAVVLVLWRVAPHMGRLLGFLKSEDDIATARRVATLPEVRDRLVNAFQLLSARESPAGTSPDLIDASLVALGSELEAVDFTAVVDRSAAGRALRRLSALALASVLVVGLFPSSISDAAFRLLHYQEAFAAQPPFTFIVEPGNAEVVRGSEVTLRFRTPGAVVPLLRLTLLRDGETVAEVRTLTPGNDGVFTYAVSALRATLTYHGEAEEVSSPEYTLRVIDRPAVRLLTVMLQPPVYTRLPKQTLEANIGDITTLCGTRAEIMIETTTALRKAALVFADGSRILFAQHDRSYAATFTVMRNGSYHIELVDTNGTPGADPVEYTIKAQDDAYPTAAIVAPGTNLDVTDNAVVHLLVRVSDDYGFRGVKLEHKIIQSRFESAAQEYTASDLPTPSDRGGEVLVPYIWNLNTLHLAPEDVVSYRVAVTDNDAVTGPKTAWSESYTLRLPSLDEVFADADQRQEASVGDMKEALKSAEEARKQLDELQRALQQENAKLDWQEKAKAEEVLKKYETLRQKMDEVHSRVEQTAAELQKNQLLTPETMEKYAELQHLLSEVSSPEFAEAMKKLREAMEQLSPEAMRQAMEQFSFSEENFRRGIERTMNLLKRIQIEQKMDELVKRAEELKTAQESLAGRTDSMAHDPATSSQLSREQKEAQRELSAMERAMAELQKKMEEFPAEMPLKEMEEAAKDLKESGLQEQMDSIEQQLEQGKSADASAQQRSAASKLGKTAKQLSQAQQSLRDRQQQQITNAMRKAASDLLELSDRQESLKDQTKGLDPSSQKFRDLAQQQMDLLRDLSGVSDRMAGLSQKTFGVTPEMGKSLGEALRSMSQSTQALDQRNGTQAGNNQVSAMANLNETARLLQNMLNAMAQQAGSGGMGMMGLFSRLQRMGGQQQSINEGTKNSGGMSPSQAAEFGRLAAEQGMVRKSLEQLSREAAESGELKKLLGDLSRAAQEMREVQTDLAGGTVSNETLRKQDRILSRLLDAQRSAHERDFEKDRKSTSGTSLPHASPGAIDLTTRDGRNRLRRDLERALEEGYARDYEELIRRYFEALELQETTPR
jgi:hypothetical protein